MSAELNTSEMTKDKWALEAVDTGLAVFPCKPDSKAPAVTGWPAWASTDPKKIREHWAAHPEHNPAAHAATWAILDVDTKGKHNGEASLAGLIAEHGGLPDTLEVQTPSGGRHLYFKLPEGVRVPNSASKIGPGLDVRSEGGYVLLPGATVNGKAYTLTRGVAAATAPQWLIDLCGQPREKVERKGEAPAAPVETDQEQAANRAREYLRTHAVAIEGQGGDARTYATLCRVRDFGVTQDQAADILAEWNARCSPPWEPDELAVKIENAYHYAQDAPGKLSPEGLGFENNPAAAAVDKPQPTGESAGQRVGAYQLLDFADLTLEDAGEWLIQGVIRMDSTHVNWGPSQVFKTFMTADMAVSLASGEPWNGRASAGQVVNGVRIAKVGVLWLAAEDAAGVRLRMIAIRQARKMGRRKIPLRVMQGNVFDLQATATIEAVIEAGRKLKADFGVEHIVLVVDTLARATPGLDENARKDMSGVVGRLDQFRNSMAGGGGTVILIHHSGVNESRMRGSTFLPQSIDSHIRMESNTSGTGGEIHFEKVKNGRKPAAQPFRAITHELGLDKRGQPITSCTLEYSAPVDADGLTDHEKALRDALLATHDKGREPRGERELWALVKDANFGARKRVNRAKAREGLILKGAMIRHGNRHGVRYALVEMGAGEVFLN